MDKQLIKVNDGKYAVVLEGGKISALRYGEPWRDLLGDKLVYCLATELDESRQHCGRLKALSVENILLDMVPGHDGMGQEVYAKSVDDVYAVLARLSGEVGELEILCSQLLAALERYLDCDPARAWLAGVSPPKVRAAIAALRCDK